MPQLNTFYTRHYHQHIQTTRRQCWRLLEQCRRLDNLCKKWGQELPQQFPAYYLNERNPMAVVIHTSYQLRQQYFPQLHDILHYSQTGRTRNHTLLRQPLSKTINQLARRLQHMVSHFELYFKDLSETYQRRVQKKKNKMKTSSLNQSAQTLFYSQEINTSQRFAKQQRQISNHRHKTRWR